MAWFLAFIIFTVLVLVLFLCFIIEPSTKDKPPRYSKKPEDCTHNRTETVGTGYEGATSEEQCAECGEFLGYNH